MKRRKILYGKPEKRKDSSSNFLVIVGALIIAIVVCILFVNL
jgi:hypothetical protein